MKTYVLTVSRTFPKTHPRYGDETGFVDKILSKEKIHTIRLNYEYWQKIESKINNGEAILSLRYWSGKPYASKQVEFMKLFKISLQRIVFTYICSEYGYSVRSSIYSAGNIPQNDGLDSTDFVHWFFNMKKAAPNTQVKEACIIHFTDFRYAN